MALLTWNSKYSVGVKPLDSQHTVLFGLLNDLHAAMLKGQDRISVLDEDFDPYAISSNLFLNKKQIPLALKGVQLGNQAFHRLRVQDLEVKNILRFWLNHHRKLKLSATQ